MARTKKRGSVVIAGYYGFGNAGDELILMSMIQQIRAQIPDADITVMSARPDETALRFNVNAVNRWKPWAWVSPLLHAERFILGGGGLLQESTGPWNYLYYLSLVVLAKFLSCRTEIHAIGVDPVESVFNRVITRLVINHFVNLPSVRDADSQRALETAGVYVRIWRVADPVFHLERPAAKTAPASASKSPTILWAFSPWNQRPGWDHDLANLLNRVTQELGVKNELVSFFPEADDALIHKVSELTTPATPIRVWTQPEELPSLIQDYDMVIGTRYHALVLAALAAKAFIGWGAQRKVRTLCSDFNQPMWTFERGWDTDAVFRQVADAWKRRETLQERGKVQMNRFIATAPIASETPRIFVAQA